MKVFAAFLLTVVSCPVFCQTTYTKLVVQLTDKANNSFTISNPSAYLSSRALARRSRYSIGIDSLDLPVTQSYVDSIKNSGAVTILSTSKWLNQVLISTSDVIALNKINSFPFVKTSSPVALKPANSIPTEKFKEKVDIPASFSSKGAGANGDVLDYGASFAQIHIHYGEYLHDKGFMGESMVIAILDAGFFQYKTISAFDSIRINGQILGERDLVDYDNSVNEDHIHGMWCLSTMAANWPGQMVGTAPHAKYWLIRTENANTEYPIEEHNWVVGAELADSAGADMISSSLGYIDFDDPTFTHPLSDLYANISMSSRGASVAAHKGMIVMNSAGNSGNSSSWHFIAFPADADSVCAVGAVNTAGQRAGFSSIGYPGRVKPNVMSVGWGTIIATPGNTVGQGDGTSFANPNLAGLVACLWQAFPQKTNMEILDAVYRSADRYNNPDSLYGYGVPDFKKAYTYLRGDTTFVRQGSEWLTVYPNPFHKDLKAKLTAFESGNAELRLVDAAGKLIEKISLTLTVNEVSNISFHTGGSLPSGVYFIQYVSSSQKKLKKVVKD